MVGKPFDLGERLLDFAATIGEIVKELPNDRLGSHLANQLIRSGTAPAAHHAEAQSAESPRDFIHKLKVGLKELRETLFWLRLAARMLLNPSMKLESSANECDELIAIFVRSIATATRNTGR
jgi:four helix bundle protein